jgi:DNA-binding transcriptional LysR family regulator
VKHLASPDFWECYRLLPQPIRDLADKNYELLKANPRHPSLQLKQVGHYWSVRVGRNHRALALPIPEGVLPLVIGRLREKFPSAEVRVFETDHDYELFEGLANGDLDVSFLVGDIGPGFQSRFLMEDPLVLLAPKGRFPAGPVTLKSLAQEPTIGQHSNSCQLTCEMGLREVGIVPNYVFRTNDNGTVAAMVRAGMGVAYMPALCVDSFEYGISVHATEPKLEPRTISIAWRSGRTLSPISEHLIDLTVDVCAELVEKRKAVAAVA